MEQERLIREKNWHNQSAGTELRKTQEEKYYRGIVGIMWENYVECIDKELSKEHTELLDYGCGDGYNLIELFSAKIKNGIGIDISEALIERARVLAEKNDIKNLEFLVMDAMNTTFNNEAFDIVKGSAILHHLDLKSSLNEIKRILKNGGKAIFFEPLGTNPAIAIYRKLTPKVRTVDERPFTRKDIKLIKEIFPDTEVCYYICMALFAVPFKKFKIFPKILSVMNFLDKIILSKYSPLKYMAWICVIVMKK